MELQFRNTEFTAIGVAEWLNTRSDAVVRRTFSLCLDVPRWVSAMSDARPYGSDAAVRRAVFAEAEPFTDDEVEQALRVHPRIGQRPVGDGEHADAARGEQSGVDVTQPDVRLGLEAGNLAYEERFGRVFLIRAAGRDASDILDALNCRLGNDPEDEARVVEHELREIAALRLVRAMSDV